MAELSPEAVIKQWQIWHTYATYGLFPIERIAEAGRAFVESGLAVVALTSDGGVWCEGEGGATTGRLSEWGSRIDLNAEGIPPYPAELMRVAIRTEAAHRRVFAGDATMCSYVRAFLEPMTLTLASRTVLLYPQIVLDSTGVMLTEFRTLSPQGGSLLSTFIDEDVNLFQHAGTAAGIPRGPLRWFLRGMIGPMRGRGSERREKEADVWLESLVARFSETSEGEFERSVVRIDMNQARVLRRSQDPPLGLRFLGQVVEIATEAAVLSRIDVLGRRNAARHAQEVTAHRAWSGRPAVYLLWDDGQAVSPSARIERSGDYLAKIMLRTTLATGDTKAALGPNLRSHFDDYAVFVNSALSLWLCEPRRGLTSDEDPNVDSVVCEKQVQVEHAETFWALHQQIRALAERPDGSLAELVQLEQGLWRLRTRARESSRYGEIWQFLDHVAERWGVVSLRTHLQEGLRLRSAMLQEQRNRQEWWFGFVLSVLLGIGASETLTDRFFVPILKKLFGCDFKDGTFGVDVVSLLGLVLGAVLMWVIVSRKTRGKPR